MRVGIVCSNAETGRKFCDLLRARTSFASPVEFLGRATNSGHRMESGDVLFLVQEPTDAPFSSTVPTLAEGGARIILAAPFQGQDEVLQAIRLGAFDCLDVRGSFDEQLSAILKRLKGPLTARTQTAKSIAVIPCCGGAGTTTLAVCLAALYAQENGSSGLLDFNFRSGDIAQHLALKPRHTILDIADKLDRLDSTMFEQLVATHASGIHVLAAPQPFSECGRLDASGLAAVFQFASRVYPRVVIEFEDTVHREQVQVLPQNEWFLLNTRPDLPALLRTRTVLNRLQRAEIARERIAVVLSRTGSPKQLERAQAEKFLDTHVAAEIAEDAGPANMAINLGVPLVLEAPRCRVAASIKRLMEHLEGVEQAESAPKWEVLRSRAASLLSSVTPVVHRLTG